MRINDGDNLPKDCKQPLYSCVYFSHVTRCIIQHPCSGPPARGSYFFRTSNRLTSRNWWLLSCCWLWACNRRTTHGTCGTSPQPLVDARFVKRVVATQYTFGVGFHSLIANRALLFFANPTGGRRSFVSVNSTEHPILRLVATRNAVLLDCCAKLHCCSCNNHPIGTIIFLQKHHV